MNRVKLLSICSICGKDIGHDTRHIKFTLCEDIEWATMGSICLECFVVEAGEDWLKETFNEYDFVEKYLNEHANEKRG